MIGFAILTVSDGVARGVRSDLSGDEIKKIMSLPKYELMARAVVADEQNLIAEQLKQWCHKDLGIRLILTTGGTGLSPRDVTPQATRLVGDYEVTGIGELMRFSTFKKTPTAALSRATACVRSKTLIINLPGSPSGVRDMLTSVLHLIPHAIEVMDGTGHDHHTRRKAENVTN